MRNVVIDAVRGALILIVVLGHALQIANGGVGNPLHDYFRSFQMEAFFIVSGYVYAYSWQKVDSLGDRLRSRVLRLLVPYFSWVVLYWIVFNVARHGEFSMAALGSDCVSSGFWFLRELFFVLFAFDVARALSRRGRVIIGTIAGGILCYLFSMLPMNQDVVTYAMYFLIGYILNRKCSDASSCGESGKCNKCLIWLGRNSLAIYAIHWNVFFNWMHNRCIDFHGFVEMGWNVYLVSIVVFAVWMAGCLMIIFCIKKNKVLMMFLLGEK